MRLNPSKIQGQTPMDFDPAYSPLWQHYFCPFFNSFFFFVINPPIRPLSFAVRLLQPPEITLSARPSSVAISNFSSSSGVFRLAGSKGFSFFFLGIINGYTPFFNSLRVYPFLSCLFAAVKPFEIPGDSFLLYHGL